jgi:carboxymethylenebutenolidase
MRLSFSLAAAALAFGAMLGCTKGNSQPSADSMSQHDHMAASTTPPSIPDDTTRPADAEHAMARLNASPRHGQYVMIPRAGQDSLRAWIVYPERSTPAPVVVVVHEIFGLSTWVRGVADQLAKEGYIAIAPDFLSGQSLPGSPDSVSMQAGIAAVSKLNMADVMKNVDAAATYGMAQPAALKKYGVVGFCWGGGVSFGYAAHAPKLGASVVYYGEPVKGDDVANVHAPVLGLYAGADARVTSQVPAAEAALKQAGKTFESHVYDGAGHGFARQQSGQNGANEKAIQQAWPATIAWFGRYLGK